MRSLPHQAHGEQDSTMPCARQHALTSDMPAPRHPSRLRLAAVAGAILLTATGCTTGLFGDDLALPPKDRAHWVMPLDRYKRPAYDPIAGEGWLVSMSSCLRDKGFDAPQVPVGYRPPADPTRNDVDYYVFNVPTAQKYGYHQRDSLPGFEYHGQRARSGCCRHPSRIIPGS